MIVYSLTFSIEEQIQAEWKLWLTQELVPYLAYHKLERLQEMKVHAEQSPGTGTFNLQFKGGDLGQIQSFMDNHESKLMDIIQRKFKDKCLVFSAVLEQVSLF